MNVDIHPQRKTIVISAINFFEGGPLSVLRDCVDYLNGSVYKDSYVIVVLVHKIKLFESGLYPNIKFIAFPKSRTSYFNRLYYEYFYFKKIAKEYHADFWLSLHDITPNVGNITQAVYCHNASPFNTVKFSDFLIQPTQFFFSLFYKYLYKINLKKNKYVIVQQLWIKKKFEKIFDLDAKKIIISKPQVPQVPSAYISKPERNEKVIFFFPTFPRPFKNIEIIGEAVSILSNLGIFNYEVVVTIDGSENRYAKKIVEKFRSYANMKFIGLISREEVYRYYDKVDFLLFPSKLETWGLPISEFKQFQKPMLVADFPYAKETVGNYDKVCFFDPVDAQDLAFKMKRNIDDGVFSYDFTTDIIYPEPVVNSWGELFDKLLN